MKMFKKPDWIKPEINEPIYYLHLLVLSFVALGLLEIFVSKGMFTVKNVLLSVPLLLAGDFVAHTILQMD